MVEDLPPLAEVYKAYLNKEPYHLSHVLTGAQAIESIHVSVPDLILLDLQLPDMDGMELLTYIIQKNLNCSVIVMTAHGSVDVAVEAMRLGAKDYLSKPISAERLKVTVKNVIKLQHLDLIVENYQKEDKNNKFHDFIGSSLVMQSIYRVIKSAASSRASVFITGESGTGKELCAQAIHRLSARKDKALITLNCAAIPAELMESEIFGHVKGAFTGAINHRKGAAEQADGGTLFLDELCELDLALQSKLLRFIQTGSYQRVGDGKVHQVDVRFVCATNRDPLKEVAAGRFREDLYYRLHVLPVHMPPLRERDDDVLEIAQTLLNELSKQEGKEFEGFDETAKRTLTSYHWPGNIRQLKNILHQLVVIQAGGIVNSKMLAVPIEPAVIEALPELEASTNLERTEPAKKIIPLHLAEKQCIEQAIKLCNGNIPKAAALLEVSPSTIYRKKQSWNEASNELT